MLQPLNFLVTGAGRGIGRGLSRILLEHGHRVFLVDSNEAELTHTCEQLSTSTPVSTGTCPKPRFSSHLCDLRSRSAIQATASKASSFFDGHLDCLINNAAYTGGVHGPDVTQAPPGSEEHDDFADAWTASLETNLTAPVLLSRACLSMLKRGTRPAGADEAPGPAERGIHSSSRSSIIMISSTRAHQSEAHSEPYAATKAGLIGLTHSLAVSLAPLGISVNAILPGWINVADECKEADERGTAWEASGGMGEADHEWHLTRRVGRVEDVARCVLYLVESADFVTGTENVVDGGVSRKMVYPE